MKNMNDIRGMLCEEIDKLRRKETSPASVNAVTNATRQILNSVKLELDYARLMNKQPSCQFMQIEEKVSISA